MGRVNLTHDEAWRAARLVVSRFHPRLTDEELPEAFHAVREVIADGMRRLLARADREASRLRVTPFRPDTRPPAESAT